jgi:hypothetical protein
MKRLASVITTNRSRCPEPPINVGVEPLPPVKAPTEVLSYSARHVCSMVAPVTSKRYCARSLTT